MDSSRTQFEKKKNKSGREKFLQFLLKLGIELVIPVLIVVVALMFFRHQMQTRPKAQRRKPLKQGRLVTVQPLEKGNFKTTVSAMGTVVPSMEVTIKPQVTGLIVSVDPVVIPGGLIKKNQVLYQIDSQDYITAVNQQESNVAKARLDMKLESGNQQVAHQEFQMLQEVINEQDKELVLRQPQMAQTKAALESAEALLDQAKLNLQRCTISAPFNAMVIEKYEDVGSVVSPSNSLVHIIGTDEYWIEVAVPVNQLRWIHIPESNEKNGSNVRIYNPTVWGEEFYLDGEVARLMGELEEQGRMAKLLVSVKDPLSLNTNSSYQPLLIGSYVRVEIEGIEIEQVVPIKREYLHNGDQVWLMSSENTLEIRIVEIEFSAKDTVYIRDGIEPGEKIITTNISAPVENMPLRTTDASSKEKNAGSEHSAAGKQSSENRGKDN